MVNRWGMGRDPETSDGGVGPGRGALSLFVPPGATGRCRRSSSPPRPARSAAILDQAYAEPRARRSIAHLDPPPRIAAYLVEEERIDGETFDALFDGRLEVPEAGDEWRAATARPREWSSIGAVAINKPEE